MRKVFAISLLVVYLFNLTGYQLLFHYFMAASDETMVANLDQSAFSHEDLIEVKVPLHMPYVTATKDYERIDGQIELEHVYYNYVMRRVQHDTLYLLCLPNYAKTKLSNGKMNYGKVANELPAGKKNNDNSIKKGNNFNEYTCTAVCFHMMPPSQQVNGYTVFGQAVPATVFSPIPWQPPQVA